jgi:uncharacterized membrane protein/predicted DsbA family dithiol-disulfide isomerase
MLEPMQKYLVVALRLAWLIALIFSVALFVHYLDPANSGYCSGRSGCEAVRRSGFGYFFGQTWLNLPLIGVVAFSAALTLTFVSMPPRLSAWLLGGAAVLGGLAALGFVALQALVIGAYCWLCMVVDIAAIVAGVVGAMLLKYHQAEQRELLARWASAAVCGLLALAPVGLWQFKPSLPLPPGVEALYVPGKINVVEFADFECPYCRTMHRVFTRLNREYGDRVNFHQLHMPLPGHVHAMRAAAAAVCAENVGKGSEMKELLFTRSLDDDSPIKHAKTLNLDVVEFERCIDSAATAQRIERDKAIILNGGFRGLPTTFVGRQRIVGWRVYPAMKEAYEAAASGEDGRFEMPPWLFLGVLGAAAVGLGIAGRVRRNSLASP